MSARSRTHSSTTIDVLQANVELALAHPTLGAEFKRYLDARYGVA